MTDLIRYRVIDHVCRICGGRLLCSDVEDGRIHVRCADCGCSISDSGPADGLHERLCSCGETSPPGLRAVVRCVRNPEPSFEICEEVVTAIVPS